MKRMFLCLLSITFISCQTGPTIREFSKIDMSEKTITVPAGGDGLLGLLKEELYNNGWDISVIANDKSVTDILSDKEISQVYYSTEYILVMYYELYSNWSRNDSILAFDFSLIDTRTKKEVLTYSGNGTVAFPFKFNKIVDGLMNKLNEYN